MLEHPDSIWVISYQLINWFLKRLSNSLLLSFVAFAVRRSLSRVRLAFLLQAASCRKGHSVTDGTIYSFCTLIHSCALPFPDFLD